MSTLFSLFVAEDGNTSRASDRGSLDGKSKPKRSNSLFGCFGGSCSSSKNLVKKDENVKLKKSKSIDVTNESSQKKTGKVKKHKDEMKLKDENKLKDEKKPKEKKSKKLKNRNKDLIEIADDSNRVPVIKSRSKNETFEMQSTNLKAINLNSTYEGPKLLKQGTTSSKKFTFEQDSLARGIQSLHITDPSGSKKLRVSPKGSINSETRLDTMKSLKVYTLNEGYKSNKISLKQYVKLKSNSDMFGLNENQKPTTQSSRKKLSTLLFENEK